MYIYVYIAYLIYIMPLNSLSDIHICIYIAYLINIMPLSNSLSYAIEVLDGVEFGYTLLNFEEVKYRKVEKNKI